MLNNYSTNIFHGSWLLKNLLLNWRNYLSWLFNDWLGILLSWLIRDTRWDLW
jgi:hypothetical protein